MSQRNPQFLRMPENVKKEISILKLSCFKWNVYVQGQTSELTYQVSLTANKFLIVYKLSNALHSSFSGISISLMYKKNLCMSCSCPHRSQVSSVFTNLLFLLNPYFVLNKEYG